MTSERQPIAQDTTQPAAKAPLLILVGADKGGTGKTTVTRALLDYLAKKSVNCRAVDTETPKGALNRFYHTADLVNLNDTQGKMSVFDALKDGTVTVVDIRAGILSSTLRALLDVGLLKDVKSGKVRLAVLHILGSTVASLSEIADTAALLLDGGSHYLVKNCANDTQFEWAPGTHDSYFTAIDAAGMITVPHLDGVAREAVETSGLPFSAFTADPKYSRTLRGYVDKWMADTGAQFDSVGIDKLVAA